MSLHNKSIDLKRANPQYAHMEANEEIQKARNRIIALGVFAATSSLLLGLGRRILRVFR